MKGDFASEIYAFAKERSIPIKKVPPIKLDKLSRQRNHQGVVGMMAAIEYQKVEDVIPFIFEKGETPLILILDGITDVRNMGAICRSAEVMGVHTIILPIQNSAEINEDAIKTSAGALLTLPVCRTANLDKVIHYLKECGISIRSSSLSGSQPIFDLDLTAPTAIILGSEQNGVDKSLLSLSDEIFKIPQRGKTDSLNVSVAAGVVLYECVRQRMSSNQ